MNFDFHRFERQRFTDFSKGRAADWCVIRQLPTLQSLIVGRFTSRIEAETHYSFMKRLYPNYFFEVMFDVPLE
ncbi:MAG: hypothetical protein HLUCCA11_24065 [Phormidesmis priestleyi Ana]|uniref:Uncharacterized protein n=1 Tax=Phormidesmis priestleyi Ana TaxID=1666911 RepID=A0A0P7ZP46_9CYAN|nr:MAG: hypothetical protein HLUCCA11_24065 [Phormidesmis priestleyi Ana]